MKTIQHKQPHKTPSPFIAEERYIMDCYGLVSDMPKCHPATNNAGHILHVTASELAKLQDQEKDAGWRFVVKSVRYCYAVLHAEPDIYGHPCLDYFTDTFPEDLPDGKKLVRARVEYAWNGNVRKWDIVPDAEASDAARHGVDYIKP